MGREEEDLDVEEEEEGDSCSIWRHLHVLVSLADSSEETVEYVLQSLWRTRSTGLDPADRAVFREKLRLPSDTALDPVLLCLRMLIRKCVHGDVSSDEIQALFPEEVTPKLKRLLIPLLQRLQGEWCEEASKDKVSIPRLKAVTWNRMDHDDECNGSVSALTLKLEVGGQALYKESEVKIQLTQETLRTMLNSMSSIRDQLSSAVCEHPGSLEEKSGA